MEAVAQEAQEATTTEAQNAAALAMRKWLQTPHEEALKLGIVQPMYAAGDGSARERPPAAPAGSGDARERPLAAPAGSGDARERPLAAGTGTGAGAGTFPADKLGKAQGCGRRPILVVEKF